LFDKQFFFVLAKNKKNDTFDSTNIHLLCYFLTAIKMKTFTSTLLFVIIMTLFSECNGSNKFYSTQSFITSEKKLNLLSYPSNTKKTVKLMLQDDPEEFINLIEGVLFVTGVTLYFINRSGDSQKQNKYAYRNAGLVLMGVSVGSGFMSLFSSANDSGNNQYGPRSSLNNSKNIQLSLNGEGLGLRFNF
jgi:hypothetical protein